MRAFTVVVSLVLVAGGLMQSPASAVPPERDASPGTSAEFVPGRLLVQYVAGTSRAQMESAERSAGARLQDVIDPLDVRVLEVPEHAAERALAGLRRNSSVRYVERDAVASVLEITPNDYWWPFQWSPVKVDAPKAWSLTTGSSDVVVAVIDTGADFSQPDLQSKLVAGYDFVNDNDDASDDHGHGTLVAGVVGAATDNGIGVASLCWECKVMPVKVLGSDGSGSYSDVTKGITWAADQGAEVINLSLGGTASSSTLLDAVRYAEEQGALLVGAAGNSGNSDKFYPSAYSEVVAVAATSSDDTLTSYSNYGSWVEMAAPGTNYTTEPGDSYGSFSGTSSAAPVVAGVAGLAFAHASSATAAEVRQAIESTAVDIGSAVAYGRVDAYGAVTALGGSDDSEPVDESGSEPVDETDSDSGDETVFTDVPDDHPFHEQITQAADAGVVTGFNDGTFRPNLDVTRMAVAAMLYRLVGEPEGPFPDPGFTDVDGDHPFFNEIAWAAQEGIVRGFEDNTFRPAASTTRMATAAFFFRVAGEPTFDPPEQASFTDVPVGHPFFRDIEWLAATAVTTGFEDGTFRPGANVTRMAMAAFVMRLDDVLQVLVTT